MIPAVTIIALAQMGLDYGPDLVREIARIFAREGIDVSSWELIFQDSAGMSVDEYLAEARNRRKGQ